MAKPDWRQIERDFRSGKFSIRDLAKKYGVNDKTIRNHRDADKWEEKSAESPQKVRSADNADDIDIKDDSGKITPEISAPEPQENASILKPQWEQFAQNIASGMPAKESAVCAGYSPSRAESQASLLMRKPAVKVRIKELRNDAALLVSFNAGHLANLSYDSAKAAKAAGKFGQVAPNIKNAAQLTGIDMGTSKTEVNVDLAGLSYGTVCIVTPANCPQEVWAAHMEKLNAGK